MMTTMQLDQLTRAEGIAEHDGLHAIKGTGGAWCVLNRTASKANGYPTYHVLRVSGDEIACDCYAATHGRICAHAAAVRMALVVEQYAKATAKTVAKREASALSRSSAAFSMWA